MPFGFCVPLELLGARAQLWDGLVERRERSQIQFSVGAGRTGRTSGPGVSAGHGTIRAVEPRNVNGLSVGNASTVIAAA